MHGNRSLICGVGVNDANYATSGKRMCPFYRRWINMLERCYSEKFQEKNPTYRGCSVCEEWLTFSNFKRRIICGLDLRNKHEYL